MNVILERLFKEYKISEKDKYEIRSMYNFLSSEKKQKLIDNFDKIYWDIELLKEERYIEQENTFWRAMVSVEDRINNLNEIKSMIEWNEDIYHMVDVDM